MDAFLTTVLSLALFWCSLGLLRVYILQRHIARRQREGYAISGFAAQYLYNEYLYDLRKWTYRQVFPQG